MKQISFDELTASLRIFNHVSDTVNRHLVDTSRTPSYYAQKALNEIRDMISANRWIMFPDVHFSTLREAASAPVPNVYVAFNRNIIEDDGQGKVNGVIGLSFNNSGAMDWLWQLFRRRSNTQAFMNILNVLDVDWKFEVSQKIKLNHQDSAPIYEQQNEFPAASVTALEIQSSIESSDANLPQHEDDYNDLGIVLNAITMAGVFKYTNVASFDEDVKKIFDLFFRILSLR